MGKSRDSRPGDSRHSNERGSESEQDKPQEAPKLSALENVWTEYQKYEKLLSGLRERIAGTQNQNLKAYLEGAADGLIMTNQRLQKKLDEESIKTVDSALAKVSGSLKNMPENKKRILRALSTEDVKEVCGVKSPVSETLEILKVLESMSEKDKEILKSANCAGATKYLELLSSIEPVEIIIREIEPVFRNPDTKIKMAQETYALRVEAFNQEIRKRISDADADPEIFAKEVSSQEKWFKNEKRDFWMLVSLSPYNDGAKNILQEDILELYRLFENRLNIVSEQAKYVTDLTRLKASTDEIKNNLRNKEKITDENEIRKFFLNSEELLIGSYNYLQSLEKLHFELRTNSVIDELKENIEQSHLEIICRMYNLYWFFAMIPEFPSLVGRQEHPNVKWAGSQLKRLATLLPMTGDYVIGEQKKFEIERAFMDERRKQQKARVTVFVSRPKSNAGQNVSEKTDAQVQDDIESIIEKESCPNNSIIFAEEAINDNGKSVYFYHDVNWQRLAKSFEMLTELSEPDLSLQNQIRSGLDLYKQMVELYTKKRELRNEEKIAKCLENYQTDRSLILNRLCRLVERARLKIHPNKIPDISDDDIAEFESISALAEPMLSWKADPSLSGCKNSNFQAERIEEQKQEYKNIAEEIKKVIQWQRAAKEMDKIYKERIEKADPEGITLDEINSIKNDLNRMSENSVEFKELASIKKIFDQLEKLIEQKILVMMKAANVDMDTINKIDPQAIGLYELYLAREDLDELVDEMQVLVDDPRLFPPIEEIYKKLDSLEKEAMKNFGFQAKEIGREIELNDNPSDFIKNDINKIIAILAESLEKEVEGLNENSSIEEVRAIRSKNSILESCTSRAVWIERGIIEKNDQTLAAAEIGCVLREIEEYTVDDSDELEKNIGDLDGFAEEINQIAGGEKDLLWIALLRIKTAIDKKMKLQEFLGHLAALLDKKQNPNLEPHPSGNPKWQAEADKILTEMKEYDPSKHLNDEIFYKDAEKWFNEVQRLIRQNEAKDDNKATELIKTLDILINTLAERRTAKKIELLKLHRRLSVLLNKKQSNASEEVSALSSGAEMHSQTPGVTFSQSEGREKEKEPHAASQLPVAVGIKDLPAEAFNICLNNLARQLIEKIEGLVISLDDPEQIKGIAEEYEKLHSIAGIEKTNGENRMLVLKDVRDLLVKKLQAIAAAHTVREDLVNDMYIYNPNIVFGDDARVEDLDKISDALKEFSRRIENMINRNLADLSYVEEQRKALLAKKNEIVKKLLNPVQQIADGYSETIKNMANQDILESFLKVAGACLRAVESILGICVMENKDMDDKNRWLFGKVKEELEKLIQDISGKLAELKEGNKGMFPPSDSPSPSGTPGEDVSRSLAEEQAEKNRADELNKQIEQISSEISAYDPDITVDNTNTIMNAFDGFKRRIEELEESVKPEEHDLFEESCGASMKALQETLLKKRNEIITGLLKYINQVANAYPDPTAQLDEKELDRIFNEAETFLTVIGNIHAIFYAFDTPEIDKPNQAFIIETNKKLEEIKRKVKSIRDAPRKKNQEIPDWESKELFISRMMKDHYEPKIINLEDNFDYWLGKTYGYVNETMLEHYPQDKDGKAAGAELKSFLLAWIDKIIWARINKISQEIDALPEREYLDPIKSMYGILDNAISITTSYFDHKAEMMGSLTEYRRQLELINAEIASISDLEETSKRLLESKDIRDLGEIRRALQSKLELRYLTGYRKTADSIYEELEKKQKDFRMQIDLKAYLKTLEQFVAEMNDETKDIGEIKRLTENADQTAENLKKTFTSFRELPGHESELARTYGEGINLLLDKLRVIKTKLKVRVTLEDINPDGLTNDINNLPHNTETITTVQKLLEDADRKMRGIADDYNWLSGNDGLDEHIKTMYIETQKRLTEFGEVVKAGIKAYEQVVETVKNAEDLLSRTPADSDGDRSLVNEIVTLEEALDGQDIIGTVPEQVKYAAWITGSLDLFALKLEKLKDRREMLEKRLELEQTIKKKVDNIQGTFAEMNELISSERHTFEFIGNRKKKIATAMDNVKVGIGDIEMNINERFSEALSDGGEIETVRKKVYVDIVDSIKNNLEQARLKFMERFDVVGFYIEKIYGAGSNDELEIIAKAIIADTSVGAREMGALIAEVKKAQALLQKIS